MNAVTRSPGGRAGAARRVLLLAGLCIAWLTLTSLAPRASFAPVPKGLVGRAQAAPEGSVNVQVQEHQILGFRVTEVVLGRASFQDELPTVVQFHGRADRPTVPTGDHSHTSPVRMVLPWAPDALGEGFTWFPLSITERDKPEKILGHHIRERADEVAEMLAAFMEQRAVEGRLLVSGFSQGGMMTMALALRHPELVDGAFPVAGWLPWFLVQESFETQTQYPEMLVMHGRGDPIVPMEPTREIVEGMKRIGMDVSFEVFAWDEHSMSLEMHSRQREAMLDLIRRRRGASHDRG